MIQQEFHFRSLMVQDETGQYRLATGEEIIEAAIHEINGRFSRGTQITSPAATKDYLRLKLAHLEHEVQALLDFLDDRAGYGRPAAIE